MLFWLVCAVLTAAVTVVTLRPMLSRGSDVALPDDEDLRVYKQQLGEVDRDIARGLLTGDEAEAARLEISRRILAARPVSDIEPAKRASGPSVNAGLVVSLTSALIVTGSLGLYLWRGSPGYSGQPLAERASKSPQSSPVNELIARVEARLREAPDDGQGWDVLAPVYLKQQRNRDAIRAYSRAIELLGETRARLRGLAEAYLAETNGIVGKEVRAAYTKMLAKEPHLIAPRFWLAVGLEQDGDAKGAAAAYGALLKDAEEGTMPPALRTLIRERLAAVTGRPAPPKPLPETGKGPPPPAGMADGMSGQQQAAMIEQMVSGLAERLDKNGGSPAEWQRLIRAYWVLGRRDKSVAALVKAKKQFASNAAAVQQLDAFAVELGMSPG